MLEDEEEREGGGGGVGGLEDILLHKDKDKTFQKQRGGNF